MDRTVRTSSAGSALSLLSQFPHPDGGLVRPFSAASRAYMHPATHQHHTPNSSLADSALHLAPSWSDSSLDLPAAAPDLTPQPAHTDTFLPATSGRLDPQAAAPAPAPAPATKPPAPPDTDLAAQLASLNLHDPRVVAFLEALRSSPAPNQLPTAPKPPVRPPRASPSARSIQPGARSPAASSVPLPSGPTSADHSTVGLADDSAHTRSMDPATAEPPAPVQAGGTYEAAPLGSAHVSCGPLPPLPLQLHRNETADEADNEPQERLSGDESTPADLMSSRDNSSFAAQTEIDTLKAQVLQLSRVLQQGDAPPPMPPSITGDAMEHEQKQQRPPRTKSPVRPFIATSLSPYTAPNQPLPPLPHKAPARSSSTGPGPVMHDGPVRDRGTGSTCDEDQYGGVGGGRGPSNQPRAASLDYLPSRSIVPREAPNRSSFIGPTIPSHADRAGSEAVSDALGANRMRSPMASLPDLKAPPTESRTPSLDLPCSASPTNFRHSFDCSFTRPETDPAAERTRCAKLGPERAEARSPAPVAAVSINAPAGAATANQERAPTAVAAPKPSWRPDAHRPAPLHSITEEQRWLSPIDDGQPSLAQVATSAGLQSWPPSPSRGRSGAAAATTATTAANFSMNWAAPAAPSGDMPDNDAPSSVAGQDEAATVMAEYASASTSHSSVNEERLDQLTSKIAALEALLSHGEPYWVSPQATNKGYAAPNSGLLHAAASLPPTPSSKARPSFSGASSVSGGGSMYDDQGVQAHAAEVQALEAQLALLRAKQQLRHLPSQHAPPTAQRVFGPRLSIDDWSAGSSRRPSTSTQPSSLGPPTPTDPHSPPSSWRSGPAARGAVGAVVSGAGHHRAGVHLRVHNNTLDQSHEPSCLARELRILSLAPGAGAGVLSEESLATTRMSLASSSSHEHAASSRDTMSGGGAPHHRRSIAAALRDRISTSRASDTRGNHDPYGRRHRSSSSTGSGASTSWSGSGELVSFTALPTPGTASLSPGDADGSVPLVLRAKEKERRRLTRLIRAGVTARRPDDDAHRLIYPEQKRKLKQGPGRGRLYVKDSAAGRPPYPT